jgi:nucleotide-binding universal stress UspA family protein
MAITPSILYPTDFSEPAEYALNLAGSLAHNQGAGLLVLHVADPLADPAHPLQGGLPLDRQRRRLETRRPQAPGVAVEHRLLSGDPAELILQTARETGCPLIVMGTKGLKGLARLLLGSVAEKVVRNAPCPVVTVKYPKRETAAEAATQPQAAAPIALILHPTDFSSPCEEAFRVACALARDLSARLVVVHVAGAPPVALPHMPVPPPLPADPREILEGMRHRLQASAPDLPMDCRVEQGNAAERIVDTARETPCDLVVMGTHGRTGLGRVLMGSVAERVLRTAPCPVVTVKAPVKA